MRKKWKEKIKSFLKRKNFGKDHALFVALSSPMLFLSWALILGSFWGAFLLTIPSVIMICFILTTGATEKEKEKNEESKRNENEQKEQDYLKALYEKAEYSSFTVSLEMKEMVILIENIQRECILTKEEGTYLTITLPKQLLYMLEIFQKIDYRYQEELEKEILAFLEEKQKEYTQTYIAPHQHQLVSECKQVLQEAKQQKHEYIRITSEE